MIPATKVMLFKTMNLFLSGSKLSRPVKSFGLGITSEIKTLYHSLYVLERFLKDFPQILFFNEIMTTFFFF